MKSKPDPFIEFPENFGNSNFDNLQWTVEWRQDFSTKPHQIFLNWKEVL